MKLKQILFLVGIFLIPVFLAPGTVISTTTMNTIDKVEFCCTTEHFIGSINEIKIFSNNAVSDPPITNQITSISSSNNPNSNLFFIAIVLIGFIFVIGSILGIQANFRRKKLLSSQIKSTNSNTTNITRYSNHQVNNSLARRSKLYCPKCRYQTTIDDSFCENCGIRVNNM